MTITEALRELERGTIQNRSTSNQRLKEAMFMGIAALRRTKDDRQLVRFDDRGLLPGETG